MSAATRRRPLWLLLLPAFVPVVVLVLCVGLFLFFRQGGLEPLRVPTGTGTPAPTDAASIERGRYLARVGNCDTCHTPRGGAPYTGGRAFPTDWGTVFSTNLTPDPDTGLGDWSLEEFRHAMRHGVSRTGMLYPVFPYANFALLEDADLDALFAYLHSLEPVRAEAPANRLDWPASWRPVLLGWRMLYHRPRTPGEVPDRSESWNRGRYLVDGLAHCDMCHSERGRFASLPGERYLAGGIIPGQGWYAPPLTRSTLERFPVDDLAHYLRSGVSLQAAASGPMAEVIFTSLQHLDAADAEAIATYIKDVPDRARPGSRDLVSERSTTAMAGNGRTLYEDHCAQCHGSDGRGRGMDYPALAGNPALTVNDPVNAVRLVLYGGVPPTTALNPRPHSMPPFAHTLSDADVAAVVTYVRGAWGNRGTAVSADQVQRMRGMRID
ncbi:c-type cytochrome [Coralloluteibacterium thermophilus]|uniref:C-type cytochrome n=1 Tax=Coralloluteibacterium thermophilum TaxID=2707049 RepID=A0ABV9NRZ1_9GAMM